MKWSAPRLPDVRRVSDRFQIYNTVINRNRAIITGSGSPTTYWRNQAITPVGTINTNLTRCYCYDTQANAPDKKHFLCQGTGYLEAYQKYGYTEIIVATPTTGVTKSANIVISGTRGSAYSISGTSITETITSARYTLTNFKDVDYFFANENTDLVNNRIEYSYSLNDTTWIPIVISNYANYTTIPIANKTATLSIPAGTQHIRFKMVFKRKTASSPAPAFNCIRFRYRNQFTLGEIDNRFNYITTPAFLASKEPVTQQVEANEFGFTTTYPLRFWVLPDAVLWEGDVIQFLVGTLAGYKFECKSIIPYLYGPYQQLSHRSFESAFIRDKNDLLGITHYLL
jgi:hypothetical protein